MNHYEAPLRDIDFVLNELAGLDSVSALPGCEDASRDTVAAVLGEAARFCAEVLAPINQAGDMAGCTFSAGEVTTAPGAREAYRRFVDGGWNGLKFPHAYGGQALPRLVAGPVFEMFAAANMGFSLCPMLTSGAIEALLLCGSQSQKATWLPPLVAGRWTGTMNLTEPQAGSDLAAVRTRAEPDGEHYRLYGQKIFVTHGEHDLAENIVHLVLARLPDAPPGVKGISLFLVPKFLVADDGSLGERNDVRCVSIEHKLGIHSSPTAVMVYGERDGAIGYLIGEANRGVEYMFIMMNDARYAVGLQGIGIAERAYQQAASYANERIQCEDAADPRGGSVPIARHPDVRRMLMSMRALTEANRAVAYVVAAAGDRAHLSDDPDERSRSRAFVEFMTPIHKGWATEAAIEVTHLAVQVHGGMGFIEETGVAQHLRDARITTIYEGTTGIQANDLVGRKIARENGATAKRLIAAMRAELHALRAQDDPRTAALCRRFELAVDAFEACVDWIVATYAEHIDAVLAGAVPFLRLAGIVCGGWQMMRAARVALRKLAAGDTDSAFLIRKLATAGFYADHLLTQVPALREIVTNATHDVLEPLS
jgi:alkylation response protein AidB-like acyl-CoA dehydrogenase